MANATITVGFDFEAFLESEQLSKLRHTFSVASILLSTSGSVSFLSSAAVICHVLRSHNGLSTTYHRLVLGLSVADLSTSLLCYALSSTMSPKEISYLMPFARGNVATCSLQGFIFVVGSNCVSLYNCSICFYYLAIIKGKRNDQYIKAKLEPWFHSLSITVSTAIGVFLFFVKGYNPGGGTCGPTGAYYPPHCIGYERGAVPEGFTIPCGRGDWLDVYANPKINAVLMSSVAGAPILITPLVIAVTMVMMYRTVRQIEKRLLNYGVSTLRFQAHNDAANGDGDGQGVNNNKFKNAVKKGLEFLVPCCSFDREKPTSMKSRFNKTASQKRSVFYMACGYALAWAFTWIPFFSWFPLQTEWILILVCAVTPLQGFFNLMVYMAPKVRNIKNSKRTRVSWCQAISRAWASKGKKGRYGASMSQKSPITTSFSWGLLNSFKIPTWISSKRDIGKKLFSRGSVPGDGCDHGDVRQNQEDECVKVETPAPTTIDVKSSGDIRSNQSQSHNKTLGLDSMLDKEEELKRQAVEEEGVFTILPPNVDHMSIGQGKH